jgi:hypothetical protein
MEHNLPLKLPFAIQTLRAYIPLLSKQLKFKFQRLTGAGSVNEAAVEIVRGFASNKSSTHYNYSKALSLHC